MTVRDMVRGAQVEMRETELSPTRASELLALLTSLLGNCNEELRIAEVDYNTVLLRFLEADEAANRAKIRAECSPEYLRKREARDTTTLVVEMIRSLKVILKAQQEEMRLAR